MLNLKLTNLKNRYNCHIFCIDNLFSLDKLARVMSDKGIIQVFQGNISSKEFLNVCFKIRQLSSILECLFIIQDRIDIAKIVDSDGIFLDSNCIDINYAKNILDETKIIGSDLTFANYSDYVISSNVFDDKITYILNSNTAQYKAINEV